MLYLRELPEISSISTGEGEIELEMEEKVEELPNADEEPVVLLARYAGDVVVVVGKVKEHEHIEGGPDIWSRIKIEGTYVSFSIR